MTIAKKNRPEPSLRQRALDALARREHTRAELARKLAPHGDDPAALEALLDELAQRGWLSNERFAEQWVSARGARLGSRRLAHELREKGVDDDAIRQALDQQDDLSTARAVWQKKFGAPPIDAREKARQCRFLQARGFSLDTIFKILGEAADPEFPD